MPNTYSQIFIHVVFAVKYRQSLILKKHKDELYKYICGVVNNKNEKVYAINGIPDHIHILLSIKPNCNLSDLVRDIKANSTKWMNTKNYTSKKFQWQEGFGAFSVSKSQISKVIKYIDNQEAHHAKKSFKKEYLEFLKLYEIEFDEKYVFEWIDLDSAPTEYKTYSNP